MAQTFVDGDPVADGHPAVAVEIGVGIPVGAARTTAQDGVDSRHVGIIDYCITGHVALQHEEIEHVISARLPIATAVQRQTILIDDHPAGQSQLIIAVGQGARSPGEGIERPGQYRGAASGNGVPPELTCRQKRPAGPGLR